MSTEFIKSKDYLEAILSLQKIRPESPVDHQIASANTAGGAEKLDYGKAATLGEKNPKITVGNYLTRLTRTMQLVELLERGGLGERTFKHCLDIGTGFGIQPRVMKAIGLVEEATGLDIYDRCSTIDESALERARKRVWLLQMLSRARRRIRKSPALSRLFANTYAEHALFNTLALKNSFDEALEDGSSLDSNLLRKVRYTGALHLDRYLNTNFFDLDEKFDLITSFSSFEWIDSRKGLPKVNEMLEDGGVFYYYCSNWWGPMSPYGLPSAFPYAAARMRREDYFAYLDKDVPTHAEASKLLYDSFDPARHSINSLFELAAKNNMYPVSWTFAVPHFDYSPKWGPTGPGVARAFGTSEMRRILEEIQTFRPDVQMLDLIHNLYFVVFQKIENPTTSPGEWLKQHSFRESRFVRSQSWLGQAGRKFVKGIGLAK